MTDVEVADLVSRCLALSPTLTWLNSPEGIRTVLWVFGLELLLHTLAVMLVFIKLGDLLGWLGQKAWAWHHRHVSIGAGR